MSSGGYSLVVDLTWGGWMAMKDMAENAGFPYVRVEPSIAQFAQVTSKRMDYYEACSTITLSLKAADDYLTDRDAMDAGKSSKNYFQC